MNPPVVARRALVHQRMLVVSHQKASAHQPVGKMLTDIGSFTYRMLWNLLFAVAGVMKPRRPGHGRRR